MHVRSIAVLPKGRDPPTSPVDVLLLVLLPFYVNTSPNTVLEYGSGSRPDPCSVVAKVVFRRRTSCRDSASLKLTWGRFGIRAPLMIFRETNPTTRCQDIHAG